MASELEMELVVVRHGETESNRTHIIQAWEDMLQKIRKKDIYLVHFVLKTHILHRNTYPASRATETRPSLTSGCSRRRVRPSISV